jgi:hypothetical protein
LALAGGSALPMTGNKTDGATAREGNKTSEATPRGVGNRGVIKQGYA